MKILLNRLFKKSVPVSVIEEPIHNIDELFNVERFNEWFVNPDKESYASEGIFLRLDILSDSFFFEYLEYNKVKDSTEFAYGVNYQKFKEFTESVRKDWRSKLNKR